MSLPAQVDRSPAMTPAAFLDEALSLVAGQAALAVISMPAPVAPLEALLRVAGERSCFLWDAPEGPCMAGIGQAVELCAAGPERIGRIRDDAGAMWARIEHVRHPGAAAVAPRMFGGFAFAEGTASAPPWDGFGDARFVLPTWCYGRDGERAWLSLAVDMRSAGPGLRGQLHAELEQVMGALSAPLPEPGPAPTMVSMTELSREDWRRGIEDIRQAIADARCQKIVAARCSVVQLAGAVDTIAVLARLADRHPGCHRFGYRVGQTAFVGATPERLVARAGDRVFAEALAGSIAAPRRDEARGPGQVPARLPAYTAAHSAASAAHSAAHVADQDRVGSAAEALLASGKDRDEQALVVQAIARELAPLCAHLDVPAEPEIRALRHVLHLQTPITGVLRAPTHVLDLVAALHPTPAVGGEPTRAALRWIGENEPNPRGWYAAPVGWFDADGDGEFAVAIRSGVLAGERAYLYAGAGIVRDSDPDAEFEETRLKLQAVLGALGVRQ